ncbi:alpha/beta fold hydrolase [Catellatospora citrea]|uniref:Hydrolase n=1 Tax=Catellatospora citrea TaxID=53366 RepID=A0A8J3P1T5_9ACTN|nr:alpha/beta hydrolase [Catellatospora citrea]RKE10817.1 pimeloyl-ACP methyl ester carboxylesterase [Catellatospora citrea]GIG00946.1 hydrolase [Catellatospora citrea]
MNDTSTVPVTSSTLQVPGARLHYEVRGAGPLVVLVGAPMDGRAFTPLAELLAADHMVLTTDPRGIFRSTVDDRDQDSTPQQRGDDLARLITHLDAGPAVVLGSSGGAVSALALAETRPELVSTVIAHEPPLDELVEDRAELRAATDDMIATYLGGDPRGAFAKFLKIANIELPPPVFEAIVGGERDEQSVADEHFQYAHMLLPTVSFVPDTAALRGNGTRVVVGIGADSTGQLCDRTSRALAASLGIEPTMFPGDHIGFADDPVAFAARLREVLAVG